VNALDAIYAVAALALSPIWATKRRAGWRERLGHVGPAIAQELATRERPRVLVHAVSVGEVAAHRTLIPLLTPHADVVLSVTTDTGTARARALYEGQATIVRYPLDFSRSVGRFLDAVRPDVVALTELELWPNFLRACDGRRIPVGVINGRLSERSFRNYARARGLLGKMFARLDFAGVQDEAYAKRFVHMGVPEGRCEITGSMKWDNARVIEGGTAEGAVSATAEELARDFGLDRSRPIVVAGSTGPGEEALLREQIAQACSGMGVQLVCAPRKPERFDDAAAALPGCVRRTSAERPENAGDLYLLDTIGELAAAYELAHVVVVGRSFFDLFGSDPTEPIGLGKPTVIGPRVGDFESIVAAFEGGGGIRRATRDDVGRAVRELLDDAPARASLAERGRAVILEHQGASRRHAAMILDRLRDGVERT
jgi:3-deoxy-D-manno-octulosonic-acid transferase